MNEPKRHHVVPQFILERFAKDGTLELLPIDNPGRVIPSNPRHALGWNEFYTIQTDEGPDRFVENSSPSTSKARAQRRSAASSKSGERSRAAPLALLIAFQRVRGPGMRHAMVEHSKALTRMMISMSTPSMVLRSAQERGEEMTEGEAVEIIEFAKSGKYEVVVKRAANLHLRLGPQGRRYEIVAAPRSARMWRVVEFVGRARDVRRARSTRRARSAPPGRRRRAWTSPCGRVHPRSPSCTVDAASQQRLRPGVDHGHGPRRPRSSTSTSHSTRTKFVVRHPGTDPLRGLVMPKKAPPVFQFGDIIAMAPNESEVSRARFLERVARGEIRFRTAFDEDDAPEVLHRGLGTWDQPSPCLTRRPLRPFASNDSAGGRRRAAGRRAVAVFEP